MEIKEIRVSGLDEITESIIAAAARDGYEFLKIVGAATVGGAMVEGEHGDIYIDLCAPARNSATTRSVDDPVAALRAARG